MHALLKSFLASPIRLGLVALLPLALIACRFSDSWDQEFVCRGEERSTTHLQAHPESENYAKVYPVVIDFHIRSGTALVKSHQVQLVSGPDQRFTFSQSNQNSSVSGYFDATSGTLSVAETQTLVVDQAPQETRITGTHHCTQK